MSNEVSLKTIITQIVHLIISKQEYTEAARLMIANNISMKELSKHTFKVSIYKMAKLTDSIIQEKKGK